MRLPITEVKTKTILNDVSVRARAGTITAILGSSGSGKTSLLNALASRSVHSKASQDGQILYNGDADISSICSAYLPQKDVLLPRLTVRETLRYAAGLRMPASSSVDARNAAVDRLIQQLYLAACADTRIGGSNETNSGCSGGEKRRTSLGVQLLAEPSVLFLDEPTSGLDAHTALSLVRLLKDFANSGCSIIMTVHQPRSEMWDLFNQIVLLEAGSALYSGPRQDCLKYFDSIGFHLPQFVNPAEFLIEIASEPMERQDQSIAPFSASNRPNLAASASSTQLQAEGLQPGSWEKCLRRHNARQVSPTSFHRQTVVQARRLLALSLRDPMEIVAALFEAITFGILTGWIFLKLDGTQSGIRSREGALYTIAVMQNYMVLVLETYRLTVCIRVFDRERADGVVDAASFLLSRRLVKLLTEDIVVPLLHSTIAYFMIGFRHNPEQFGIFFVIVLLGHLLAVNAATICVALFRDFARASLLANMIFTLNSICSGVYINSNQIPVYVRWLKYIAFMWHGTGALVTNEFVGKSSNSTGYLYDCPYVGKSLDAQCAPWTGTFVVSSLGYPLTRWTSIPAVTLAALTMLYALTSWLILYLHVESVGTAARIVHNNEAETYRLTKSQQGHQFSTAIADQSGGQHRGMTIRLTDLSLTIEQRRLPSFRKDATTLLSSINTSFRPQALNVILGVSGSGKTSLLRLIADRLHNGSSRRYTRDGLIEFMGPNMSEPIARPAISFLCQDDDGLIPTLTVRETLHFAARLVMSRSAQKQDVVRRAEDVIKRLELEGCADVLVGDDNIKGVSGGERRRVSIAMQLLREPDVLILDEPTSGLDARMASKIIAHLHDLAQNHCTVIVALHQPSSIDFEHFDEILLLTQGGHPVYAGPGGDMLPRFESRGLKCPASSNPADFTLDNANAYLGDGKSEVTNALPVAQEYKSRSDSNTQRSTTRRQDGRFCPYLNATNLLLARGLKAMQRSSSIFVARVLQAIGYMALLVLFFSPLKKDYEGVQAHAGFLQLLTGLYFVGLLQNIAVYPAEQKIFERDHEDGFYGAGAFLTAYTVLEAPLEMLTCSILAMLSTLVIGLPRTKEVFGVVWFCSFALINIGESVGIMFCALFRSTGFAVSVTNLVLAAGLLLSGIFSTDPKPVLKQFNYLNPGKWSIGAMAPYTLRGTTFTCSEVQKNSDGHCPITTDKDVLKLYNLQQDGVNSLIYLAALIVGYRLLAYCLLKVKHSRWKSCKRWRHGARAVGIV